MRKRDHTNDTFVDNKVTNRMIYDKIDELSKVAQQNRRLAQKAMLIGTGAMTLAVMTLGFLIQHINK